MAVPFYLMPFIKCYNVSDNQKEKSYGKSPGRNVRRR